MLPLYLASASPRRRELLSSLGLAFGVAPAAVDEAELSGEKAQAWSLYAGLDSSRWRTYQEVGCLMGLSKERVRQLLYPAKLILTAQLGGNVPWKPLPLKTPRPPRAARKTLHHPVPHTRSSNNAHAVIS